MVRVVVVCVVDEHRKSVCICVCLPRLLKPKPKNKKPDPIFNLLLCGYDTCIQRNVMSQFQEQTQYFRFFAPPLSTRVRISHQRIRVVSGLWGARACANLPPLPLSLSVSLSLVDELYRNPSV